MRSAKFLGFSCRLLATKKDTQMRERKRERDKSKETVGHLILPLNPLKESFGGTFNHRSSLQEASELHYNHYTIKLQKQPFD